MKTSKSIIRVSALAALAIVAAAGILSFPLPDSQSWALDFIVQKAIGLYAACKFHQLYSRWSKSDPWVSAYDRWCGAPRKERQT